jgi:hypothetical protein
MRTLAEPGKKVEGGEGTRRQGEGKVEGGSDQRWHYTVYHPSSGYVEVRSCYCV